MLRKRKTKKKPLGQAIKKFFFWVLFLSFFGISGWVLFFSNYTELKKVEFVTDQLDKKLLEKISNKHRSEFWFKYVSKNNFFFFPRSGLSEELKNAFKSIRAINFKNKFPDKIVVEIKERQGIIIWCTQEDCFLVDETGLVFYKLQNSEREKRFKEYDIVFDTSHLEIEEGWMIGDGYLVEFVDQIKELIQEKMDLEIQREMETPSMISQEIRVKTEQGWQIYFNIEDDPSDQVNLLKEILVTSISEKERKNISYIDLRIAGKAIYKASVNAGNDDEDKDDDDDIKED